MALLERIAIVLQYVRIYCMEMRMGISSNSCYCLQNSVPAGMRSAIYQNVNTVLHLVSDLFELLYSGY